MQISTNGIIANENNQVLLIKRSDSRTFAPPGGGLDFGELPPQGAEREVFEETGLVVKAEKLAAVFFWPNGGNPYLTFSFQCKVHGGEITPSWETPRVKYFLITRLPLTLLPFHRERVLKGLAHTGRSPFWGVQRMKWFEALGVQFLQRIMIPYWKWRYQINRGIDYEDAISDWVLGAFVVIRNDAGEVLWVKRTDADVWNLPGGGGHAGEPPWETAVRETYEETGLHVHLEELTGVYLYDDKRHVIFTYTAVIQSGTLTTGPESAGFAFFAPGGEPENVVQQHVERTADACYPRDRTHFRFQNSKTAVSEKTVQPLR